MGGVAWQIPLSGIQPKFNTVSDNLGQALDLSKLAGAVQIQKQLQQENALKIQAAQEDENDQKTIQDAFQNRTNWSTDETGKLAPDFGKVRDAVAPSIRLRNLQNLEQFHLNSQKAASSLTNEQIQNGVAQNKAIGQAIDSMLQLPEGSPERQVAHDVAVSRLQKLGIDTSKFPTAAQSDDVLTALAAGVGYNGTLLTNAQKEATQKKAIADAKKVEQANAETEKQQEREAIARLYQTVSDQPSHDQWLATVKKEYPEVAAEYANLKTFDQAKTPTVVNGMALNAKDRGAQIMTEQQRVEQAARDAETNRHNRAQEGNEAEQRRLQKLQVDPFGLFGGDGGVPSAGGGSGKAAKPTLSSPTVKVKSADGSIRVFHFADQKAADAAKVLAKNAGKEVIE